MPVIRHLTHRRRSSLAIGLTPVKPGNYGITTTPSPRNVTFAPNVTPGTYVEPDASASEDAAEPVSPDDAIFPPSESTAPSSSRRRVPPGKRRSQGYIPRPPNAFMLFRADFVRQKHVPGSIETNHGSLSKIIGNCWRALPLDEKKIWENRAKKAKAEHRERYPNYRFRPVHNKHKKHGEAAQAAAKSKIPLPITDERRCEEVAQLLLEGKKGDELAAAVRKLDLDRAREFTVSASASPMLHMPVPLPMAAPSPLYAQRRPSSVPPPSQYWNPIGIPSLPFLMPSMSRPVSPVGHISSNNRFQQIRRSSSAMAMFPPSSTWGMQTSYNPSQLQPDDEPLIEANMSHFEPSFFDSSAPFSFGTTASGSQVEVQNPLYVDTQHLPPHAMSISPLDPLYSADQGTAVSSAPSSAYPFYSPADPVESYDYPAHQQWMPTLEPAGPSGPSSAFSGSPASSDASLPATIIAPQPQHAVSYDSWNDKHLEQQHQQQLQLHQQQHQQHQGMVTVGDLGLDLSSDIELFKSSEEDTSGYLPQEYHHHQLHQQGMMEQLEQQQQQHHHAEMYHHQQVSHCGDMNPAYAYSDDMGLNVQHY